MANRTPINISSFDSDQQRTIEDLYDIISDLTTEDIVDRRVISLVSGGSGSGSSVVALSDLNDVNLSTISANDVLAHNGSDWINTAELDLTTITIDGNWKFDSQSEGGTERLRMQAVGANDAAELFLQAKGSANAARISVTPESSASNFTALTLESNGTNHSIESTKDGTASLLPIVMRMGGTDAITIDTSGSLTFTGATFTGNVTVNNDSTTAIFTADGAAGSDSLFRLREDGSTKAQLQWDSDQGTVRLFEWINTDDIFSFDTGTQEISFPNLIIAESGIQSNDRVTIDNEFLITNSTDSGVYGFIMRESGAGRGQLVYHPSNNHIELRNILSGEELRMLDGGGSELDGTLTADTIQTQTLRTTLFKPTTVIGMGGEFGFNSTSTVVSIDTGANTIVAEDAVFANGDAVIVSSAIYNQTGFSNVELNITSNGTSVTGGTEYDYTVNSGDEADIDTGDTILKLDGNLIYVDATEGVDAPLIEGYRNLTGFSDSPLSGGSASPSWQLSPEKFFYEGLTDSIFNQNVQAAFTNNDTVSDSDLTNGEWKATLSSSTTETITSSKQGKAKIRFFKKYGHNKLLVRGYIKRTASGSFTSANTKAIVEAEVGGQSTSVSTTSSSYGGNFTLDLDISGLTDDTFYIVTISLQAQLASTGSSSMTAFLREDISVIPSGESN